MALRLAIDCMMSFAFYLTALMVVRPIAELVKQVELNCPEDDTILDVASIKVSPSTVGKKPLLIIEMPQVQAYAECIYIGIVAMMDINNPEEFDYPEIRYFTLELGEGESRNCRIFCQWQDSTHYNLAEMDENTGIDDFILVINQRLGEQ